MTASLPTIIGSQVDFKHLYFLPASLCMWTCTRIYKISSAGERTPHFFLCRAWILISVKDKTMEDLESDTNDAPCVTRPLFPFLAYDLIFLEIVSSPVVQWQLFKNSTPRQIPRKGRSRTWRRQLRFLIPVRRFCPWTASRRIGTQVNSGFVRSHRF